MKQMTIAALILAAATGCSTRDTSDAPRRGVLVAPSGGANGYQHGSDGSRFVVGRQSDRIREHGYVKVVGDQGTLAIDEDNGSVFARPRADAAGLALAPYGASPDDHNRFVRDYFETLGVPRDQIASVRGMTMLEASGRSNEDAARAPRQVIGYYSVLDRVVDGVAVPDSFAWARADAQGRVIEEGVYWPVVPADAIAQARRIRQAADDPERRGVLQSRVPQGAYGSVAIRHTSATTDRMFTAVGTYDVLVRQASGAQDPAATAKDGQSGGRDSVVVVLHFNERGETIMLPQESLGAQRTASAAVTDQPR